MRSGLVGIDAAGTGGRKMLLTGEIQVCRQRYTGKSAEVIVVVEYELRIDTAEVSQNDEGLNEHRNGIGLTVQSGIYKSKAVLGISIPKRSGGERLLSIPTTFDRMIQQAMHQELSPLFEPEFSQFSYGF